MRDRASLGFAAVTADLQPMAVGRGSLAAHAPVAGADAVERVHAAARPLRGTRVLHVTRGRRWPQGGREPGRLAAVGRRRRACGSSGGCCSATGGVGQALRDGLQGAETAIIGRGLRGLRGRVRAGGARAACPRRAGAARPRRPGPGERDRQAGGVALPRRRRAGRSPPPGSAPGRWPRRARRGRWPRRALRRAGPRGRGDRAGHRSAERAQRRQLAVAHRAGRALAGPRPRPPDRRARSCRWTAGRTRTRRSRPSRSRARSCPTSSWC